jgi:hypothetical protein
VGAKFSLFNGIVLFSRRDDVGGTSRALFSDDSSRSVAKHFFYFFDRSDSLQVVCSDYVK